MELQEAIDQLTRVSTAASGRIWSLHVKVMSPGTVGGSPCEELTAINVGFDWDNGKIIFDTKSPLTKLSLEDVAAIHKSAKEGQSWHAYQSYKKQADRIKALETELADLKAKHHE
jgi:hypothetical protein